MYWVERKYTGYKADIRNTDPNSHFVLRYILKTIRGAISIRIVPTIWIASLITDTPEKKPEIATRKKPPAIAIIN